MTIKTKRCVYLMDDKVDSAYVHADGSLTCLLVDDAGELCIYFDRYQAAAIRAALVKEVNSGK